MTLKLSRGFEAANVARGTQWADRSHGHPWIGARHLPEAMVLYGFDMFFFLLLIYCTLIFSLEPILWGREIHSAPASSSIYRIGLSSGQTTVVAGTRSARVLDKLGMMMTWTFCIVSSLSIHVWKDDDNITQLIRWCLVHVDLWPHVKYWPSTGGSMSWMTWYRECLANHGSGRCFSIYVRISNTFKHIQILLRSG